MPGKHKTTNDVLAILNDVQNEVPFDEIAKKYDCTEQTIKKYMRKAGVYTSRVIDWDLIKSKIHSKSK